MNYSVSGSNVLGNDSRTVNKDGLTEINFELLSLLGSRRFDMSEFFAIKLAADDVITEDLF